MVTVNVTDREGGKHVIDAEDDLPLMFSLREAELPVEGTCGGTAGCGTCHVFVSEPWRSQLPEKGASESDMLEALENFDEIRSRLSCQIDISEALEGLEVQLAPEEIV